MFLHLTPPDPKHIRKIHAVFEDAAPGEHQYISLWPVEAGEILPAGMLQLPGPGSFAGLAHSGACWEGIISHGIPFETMKIVLDAIPRPLPVACYVWGGEVYGVWPALSRDLLMPETQRLVNRLGDAPNRHRGPRRAVARWQRQRTTKQMIWSVTDRYDYCVSALREDYDLYVATHLFRKARYIWGSYGALADYVETSQGVTVGDSIQLGNSAYPANNHLDGLRLIASVDKDSAREVIVPLSYGPEEYRDAVVAAGRALLPERFVPLLGFMPLAEYDARMRQCGHVVMNQIRQQAWGNIVMALWRGARVYMHNNTIYQALRRLGVDVRLVEESLGAPSGSTGCSASRSAATGFERCTTEQAERHRQILAELLDRDRVRKATQDLLQRLGDDANARGRSRTKPD